MSVRAGSLYYRRAVVIHSTLRVDATSNAPVASNFLYLGDDKHKGGDICQSELRSVETAV